MGVGIVMCAAIALWALGAIILTWVSRDFLPLAIVFGLSSFGSIMALWIMARSMSMQELIDEFSTYRTTPDVKLWAKCFRAGHSWERSVFVEYGGRPRTRRWCSACMGEVDVVDGDQR